MKALQYRTFGVGPELVDIDRPKAGSGQVLLRMTAAGLCHTDIFLMGMDPLQLAFGELPLTLGHEGAGVVEEHGPGTSGVSIGQRVAVYARWGCGACHHCTAGRENICPKARELGIYSAGLGTAGALAECMVVDHARHLIYIGGLDPAIAAPLTDAGLTPYRAIKESLSKLDDGSTVTIIGVGGLGHLGIQIVKALSHTRVIALDLDDRRLELAEQAGADFTLLSTDAELVPTIRRLTDGRMSDVVLDFAGYQSSLDIAKLVVGIRGLVRTVGIGMGGAAIKVGFFLCNLNPTLVQVAGERCQS